MLSVRFKCCSISKTKQKLRLNIVTCNENCLIELHVFVRDLQGTNMEGPIPSTISQLKLLTEL